MLNQYVKKQREGHPSLATFAMNQQPGERRCILRREGDKISDWEEAAEQKPQNNRRKIQRRIADRAKEIRRQYWREQKRSRVEYAFRMRYKRAEQEKWFSRERVALARRQAAQSLTYQRVRREQDLKQKAISLGLMHGLDLSKPAATILLTWQKELMQKRIKRYYERLDLIEQHRQHFLHLHS